VTSSSSESVRGGSSELSSIVPRISETWLHTGEQHVQLSDSNSRIRTILAWGLLALCLRGLAQTPGTFSVDRFVVEGDNPLPSQDVERALQPFLGQGKTATDLKAPANALQDLLFRRGFSSHRVVLPEQEVTEGTIKLRILAFRVGAINVTGNSSFSTANVLASVPALKEGTTPDAPSLSRQLVLANEHPSKALNLTFKEGDAPQSMNATLAVVDQRPWSVFGILNNRGARDTPTARLTVGAQHSNLFDKDHTLTATYTTAPANLSRIKQYGIDYKMPLYKISSALGFYYTHSNVDSGRVLEFFEVSGAGDFAGLNLDYHLPRVGRLSHKFSFGLEDKAFKSQSTFLGEPVAGNGDVRSRPLSVRYGGTYSLDQGNASFHIGYAHNLTGGADNDDRTYASARTGGAKNNWDAWRLMASFDRTMAGSWRLVVKADGQHSDDRLISGEQFGLGGATSVRGYDERIASGDSGLTGSVELWSPPIKGSFRLLGFLDGGYRDIRNPSPGEGGSDELLGFGVGLRAAWKRNVSLEVDIAHAERNRDELKAPEVKAHANLVVRY
jgi:hemolysin activation/secretion protein